MTHDEPAPEGSEAARACETLRQFALGFPEAHEDRPWGHVAIKVRRKTFVFLAASDGGLSLSAKLPESNQEALLLPFAARTGYGLGKSGWVTASFDVDQAPPLQVLFGWIDESFRAIAPKKLVEVLHAADEPSSGPDRGTAVEAAAKRTAGKRTATRKSAAKKVVRKKTAAKKTAARRKKP